MSVEKSSAKPDPTRINTPPLATERKGTGTKHRFAVEEGLRSLSSSIAAAVIVDAD
jgi:hypothetical protein